MPQRFNRKIKRESVEMAESNTDQEKMHYKLICVFQIAQMH
jgi:hypothetical protein